MSPLLEEERHLCLGEVGRIAEQLIEEVAVDFDDGAGTRARIRPSMGGRKMPEKSPKDPVELQRKYAIEATWQDCRALFNSNIFSSEGARSPLFQAATVLLLINLNDLLQKASADKARVEFSDDVDVRDRVKDVTDLVRECRNAACHIGSTLSDIGFGKFRFGVLIGKCVGVTVGDEPVIKSDYEDDIAIFYGDMRLYLRRHAFRAWQEVGKALGVRM
ncbi:hypothetical protein [Burkholderia gladioli]|uniref:hypothetical protein n=1 Tax=Burkholderia gladioli TaxID=28095 RepID=UPI00164168D3|nr:hypothetical protein [Burkholderia gladioli]